MHERRQLAAELHSRLLAVVRVSAFREDLGAAIPGAGRESGEVGVAFFEERVHGPGREVVRDPGGGEHGVDYVGEDGGGACNGGIGESGGGEGDHVMFLYRDIELSVAYVDSFELCCYIGLGVLLDRARMWSCFGCRLVRYVDILSIEFCFCDALTLFAGRLPYYAGMFGVRLLILSRDRFPLVDIRRWV